MSFHDEKATSAQRKKDDVRGLRREKEGRAI